MPVEWFNTDNRVVERDEEGFEYKTPEGIVLAKLRLGQELSVDHHVGVGPNELDMETDELGTTYLVRDSKKDILTVAIYSGEMMSKNNKRIRSFGKLQTQPRWYKMLIGVDKECVVRSEDLRYPEPHVLLPPLGAGWDKIKSLRRQTE